MVRCVEAWEERKVKPGRPSALSGYDQVLMLLEYLRDYPTFFRLGFDWGVDESTAGRAIRKVEQILMGSGEFKLPGKRKLGEGLSFEVIVVDVGEVPIQGPQKSSTGTTEKKRHTLKIQLVVDRKTHQIICVEVGRGQEHDFTLYKHSKLVIHKASELLSVNRLRKHYPKKIRPGTRKSPACG